MHDLHRKFWTEVYVAAIRAGHDSYTARTRADDALAALKKREAGQ